MFKLILTVLWAILFIWALIDIIKANKDTGWKAVWIIVCLVFPVVGTIIYYIFARQKNMNLPGDFQKL